MKKLIKAFAIFLFSIAILGEMKVQAHEYTAIIADDYSSLVPFADIIEWKYKIEDGKMYKRLYNHTKQEWIGEWILVS